MAVIRRCSNPDTPHVCTDPSMTHCPRCGYEIPEVVEAEEEEQGEDQGELQSDEAAPLDAPIEAEPSDRPNRPIAATTMEQAAPLFFVRFPWGEEQVFDVLNVGRDPEFSPLAREIREDRNPNYAFVSGAHARFEIEDGTFYVEHIGSSNPTYVGGVELVRGSRMPLYDGVEVQFSSYLSCTVVVPT